MSTYSGDLRIGLEVMFVDAQIAKINDIVAYPKGCVWVRFVNGRMGVYKHTADGWRACDDHTRKITAYSDRMNFVVGGSTA